jgi:hypothetical protein
MSTQRTEDLDKDEQANFIMVIVTAQKLGG